MPGTWHVHEGKGKQKRCRLCPHWACNLMVETNEHTVITHCNKTAGESAGHGRMAREGHLPRLEDQGGLPQETGKS